MNTYVVPQYNAQTGEGTLSGAAQKHGVTLAQLLEANPQYKANPNMVKVGDQLNIPLAAAPVVPAPVTPVAGGVGGAPVDPPATPPITPAGAPVAPPAAPVIPTQAETDAANKALATLAGQAGLSVDELNKILGRKSGLTQLEVDAIRTGLGIPALEGSVFKTPAKSTEQAYQDAYTAAGLGDIKTSIKKLQDDIASIEIKKADIIGKVNENPFLTEASRTGRAKRDTETLNSEIAAKQNQIEAYSKLYAAGTTEVNNTVTRMNADFETNANLQAKELEYLLKKAEAQAEIVKTGKADAVNQFLPDYLKGRTGSNKPDTIGTAETGFYRWDPKTGKFVLAINGTGTKPTEKGGEQLDVQDMATQLNSIVDTDGFVTVANYKKARNAWVTKSGRTAKSFDESFAHYRNPEEDYNVAL